MIDLGIYLIYFGINGCILSQKGYFSSSFIGKNISIDFITQKIN
jgi:hypothetical protein